MNKTFLKALAVIITLIFVSNVNAMGWFSSDDEPEVQDTEHKAEIHTESNAKTAVFPPDYVLGNPNSKVKIVEYSSMTCPHCADFHLEIFPKIKKEYIDNNKISYVFRHYPLDKRAFQAAMISHCAGKDKYYKFIDVFLKTQMKWALSTNYLDNLKMIAKLGGMSNSDFEKCLANKDLEEKILHEMQKRAVGKYNVKGTPSIFINGMELSPTKRNFKGISQEIEKIMN